MDPAGDGAEERLLQGNSMMPLLAAGSLMPGLDSTTIDLSAAVWGCWGCWCCFTSTGCGAAPAAAAVVVSAPGPLGRFGTATSAGEPLPSPEPVALLQASPSKGPAMLTARCAAPAHLRC